ncbi:MAG: hypothetical protein ACK6CT_08725, partial [Planctomycetia bacterium]
MRQIWEDLCGLVRDLGPNCARWRAGVTGSLTPAQARRIVTGLRGPLVLEGVTELSPEAAGVLDGQERMVSKVIDLAAGDAVELALDPASRTASAESTAATRQFRVSGICFQLLLFPAAWLEVGKDPNLLWPLASPPWRGAAPPPPPRRPPPPAPAPA